MNGCIHLVNIWTEMKYAVECMHVQEEFPLNEWMKMVFGWNVQFVSFKDFFQNSFLHSTTSLHSFEHVRVETYKILFVRFHFPFFFDSSFHSIARLPFFLHLIAYIHSKREKRHNFSCDVLLASANVKNVCVCAFERVLLLFRTICWCLMFENLIKNLDRNLHKYKISKCWP